MSPDADEANDLGKMACADVVVMVWVLVLASSHKSFDVL